MTPASSSALSRLVDQSLEHVDVPARQRDGVGFAAAHDLGVQRDRQRRPPLRACRSAGRAPRGPAFPRRPAPHSNGRPALPLSSMLAHLGIDRLAEPRSTRSGTSGAIRSASAGTPKTPTSTSDTAAAMLQPMTFCAAAPLGARRCGRRLSAYSSISGDQAPGRAPRAARARGAAGAAEPQHAVGRRLSARARHRASAPDQRAVGVAMRERRRGRASTMHGVARAGRAVEKDAASRSPSQIPPTLSASARPSPTAELPRRGLDPVEHLERRRARSTRRRAPEPQASPSPGRWSNSRAWQHIEADAGHCIDHVGDAPVCRAETRMPSARRPTVAADDDGSDRRTAGHSQGSEDRRRRSAGAQPRRTVSAPKRKPEIHQRSTIAWNTG